MLLGYRTPQICVQLGLLYDQRSWAQGVPSRARTKTDAPFLGPRGALPGEDKVPQHVEL